MERIQQPEGTALYFCDFWCADSWITANQDRYPDAESVESDLRPRECVYCAACGIRIVTGSNCPLCSDARPCPEWDWLMTATAVDFAQELGRRGRLLTAERQAAAEFLVASEPDLSGAELAEIILAGPASRGDDWPEEDEGDAPQAA